MDKELIRKKFEAMGARIKFRDLPWSRNFRLDISRDGRGEYFDFAVSFESAETMAFQVIDLRPGDRHLLLLARDLQSRGSGWRRQDRTEKILCGHDERHWFAAGVNARAVNVEGAMDTLKPAIVRGAESRKRLGRRDRHRRKNAAFLRQGEWFFIPAPEFRPESWLILRNEPLLRGAGKPHRVDFLYRRGGTTVQVCREHPDGLTEPEYRDLIRRLPEKKNLPWRTMSRNPEVFARGRVRHPDHKTVVLHIWHRVSPNEEVRSAGVAFLD